MVRLEVIASTLDDAVAAETGGADSVEVCVDLSVDGLTPPLDMVKAIRDAVQLDMNVMLRPHNNGFVYDARDIALMQQQIEAFKPLGIQTLVFGAHDAGGAMDTKLIKQVAEATAPLPLTVHRALERSSNPDEALRQMTDFVARILTSGPAASAPEGREGLRRWVETFGEHYRFAVGGGVRFENARDIVTYTGVHECHVGSAVRINDAVDAGRVGDLLAIMTSLKKDRKAIG